MKKPSFEIPKNPLLETATKLIQKPEWLEAIERQKQLFDIGLPMHSMLVEYSNILSCTPVHLTGLKGLTTGLKTYNCLLDINAFNPNEHIAGIQAMLTSVADSFSTRIPHSWKIMRLHALSALELETASILKAAETELPFTMHSLQIVNSLQSLTSLHPSTLVQIDKVLASSRLIKDYTSLVERQYIQIQRNIECSTTRLKIIDIATDLLQDQLVSAAQYTESEYVKESIFEEIPLANARTGIQFIPSYLGYTFPENAEYDLYEEFAKSMISKILNSGKQILHKITNINELRMATGQTEIFTPTTKVYTAVQCLLTSFSTDDITFGSVIDSLYMLIYEGSGGAKRIREVLTDTECTILWNIKHIRTDFRHDIEHGDEKKYLAKKRQIGRAYQTICGKPRPLKQKDWVTAHFMLFKQVDELLQSIIDKLSAAC